MVKRASRPKGASHPRKVVGRGASRHTVRAVSMTGFGRAVVARGDARLTVEARSVNNRFTDIILKLPREYSAWESDTRAVVEKSVERGRIDITVVRTLLRPSSERMTWSDRLIDEAFAGAVRAARRLKLRASKEEIFTALLARRDLVEVVPENAILPAERELLLEGVARAMRALQAMRVREGMALGVDVAARVQRLEEIGEGIAKRASTALALVRERLESRVRKLAGEVEIDPARVATEVVMMAERSDIEEELVRLRSHLVGMRSTLAQSPNGRKLEFLVQELGREFNTIGSKAQDVEIQSLVVEAKSELERIREQLQNIE